MFRLLAGKPRARVRTIARDSLSITLPDGQCVELLRVRHPRARRLRLSVDERGARLTLPPRASDASGERVVLEHADWLSAQLAGFGAAPPPLQPFVTDAVPLRDALLPLAWREGRFLRLDHDADGLRITAPADVRLPSLRRAMRDFYEAQARADVGRWMPRYLPGLPRPPSRVRLGMTSSQWGSLSPDGALSLDLALVVARPSAFEYVLVHELCHLIHADHSRRFWREVEARFPAWREERDYFKAEGRRLKASLRVLLAAK